MKKCCGKDQILDAVSLACVDANSGSQELKRTSFAPSYMLNMTLDAQNIGQALLSVSMKPKQFSHGEMVECRGEYKLLDLTKPLEYLISTDGELVSLAGQYELSQRLGDFCLDIAAPKVGMPFRAALICDPCESPKMCLRTCCSHLQVGTVNDLTGEIQCSNPEGGPTLARPQWHWMGSRESNQVVMVHR